LPIQQTHATLRCNALDISYLGLVTLKKPDSIPPAHSRADGRKSLLVYLQPELIKDLKKAALDDERNAYEIVEEAIREWLPRRSKRGHRP
jgi:hypothetical protein